MPDYFAGIGKDETVPRLAICWVDGQWAAVQRGNGTDRLKLHASGDLAQTVGHLMVDGRVARCVRPPCTYHPRIWRDGEMDFSCIPSELPDLHRLNHRAWLVLRELLELGTVIELAPANDDAYGERLREFLILCCTEVEASWRAVFDANGVGPVGGRFTTVDYVRLLGLLRLDAWGVKLWPHDAHGEIRPFSGWDATRPTQSLSWYDAYNAVKHDHGASLPRATLKNCIEAATALYVMGAAQYGPHWNRWEGYLLPMFRLSAVPSWPAEERYAYLPNVACTAQKLPF